MGFKKVIFKGDLRMVIDLLVNIMYQQLCEMFSVMVWYGAKIESNLLKHIGSNM